MEPIATQSTIPPQHPTKFLNQSWVINRQFAHQGKFQIEHQIQTRSKQWEFNVPGGSSMHGLYFQFSTNPRRISRWDGREKDEPLLPGDFFLVPAKLPVFQATTSPKDEGLLCFFEPSLLAEIATEADINCQIELQDRMRGRDLQIELLATTLKRELDQGGIGGQLYRDAIATAFLIHLLRNYCTFPPKCQQHQNGLSRQQLKLVQDYIKAHLEEDMSLADLANVVNLSQYYFARMFKQSTGITPHQYLVQQRIERAKKLLKQRDLSIVDIALACGFPNQAHLTRRFRQVTNTTPYVYRHKI